MVQHSKFGKVKRVREQFINRSSSKKLMFGILLFLFVANTFGQTTSISREQMKQDIDILFSTIEEVHPDMCAVYPKEQLDKDIEKVKSEFEPSGDKNYFFKHVTPLVVKLGDGHTSIHPPLSEPEDFANILLFPLGVKITYPDKLIHVQNDYTQTQNAVPIGAQITSINNRQAYDLVQEMMNYVSGEKDFFKIYVLEYYFTLLIHTLYDDSIFDIDYIVSG